MNITTAHQEAIDLIHAISDDLESGGGGIDWVTRFILDPTDFASGSHGTHAVTINQSATELCIEWIDEDSDEAEFEYANEHISQDIVDKILALYRD